MALPLAGLRVLDLSRALADPFCTMILGDLGTDIVRVEPLPDGEVSRAWGPFDLGFSVYNLSINRNKRSLAINFRDKAGLELLREMAMKSDVLVKTFAREPWIRWDSPIPLFAKIITGDLCGDHRQSRPAA